MNISQSVSFFKHSSKRFSPLVTALFVLAWVALMAVLLRGQYLSSAAPGVGEGFQIAATETDDWFLLRIGGKYAGFGRSRQFRGDGEWIIRDDLSLSLNLQGQVKPVKITNESRVDEAFRLISFHMKVTSGIISFEQKGRMDGRDLVLEIPRSQGGGTKRLKLHESPRITRSLGLPIPLTGLRVGEEIHVPIFDPLDGNKWDAVIQVLERAEIEVADAKVPAWRVRAIFRAVDLTMWIDDEGRLLKGRMPLNITVARSDKNEISREMKTRQDLPDLVSMSSVPLEGSIPESQELNLVRLQLEGTRELPIPNDPARQTVEKSEITVRKENEPRSTYKLPCDDPRMAQYLVPSRFIRSDHPDIIKASREIVGDEQDPVKAAALINKWVHDHLKKVPTATVPDALTVFKTKQGACNEHAVLAAALARAQGIPARIAVGLIHLDGGFFYHAWVSYWAGDKWFTGDPLANRLPVGPSYVTLLYGDVDKHINVLSFLGKLKLKVLEAN